jgi:uncharacterized repeat protein (TIGR04138 family)
MKDDFYQKIEGIIEKDPRYSPDAYEFVMQALWFTQAKLKRKDHVTGRQLSVGARRYALSKYGPLARGVLSRWGIKKTDDFGEIVFNMIDSGLMSKTDSDTRDDFKGVYDFAAAFEVYKARNLKK